MINLKVYVLFIMSILLMACQNTPSSNGSMQINSTRTDSLRTIVLNNEEMTENTPGQFPSWRCKDYSGRGSTLVELGYIDFTEEELNMEELETTDEASKAFIQAILDKKLQLGFVLYEGTNKGEFTFYGRRGLNHRWDWGPEGKYSFIIKPDGTGLFYDFTTSEDGTKEKADDVYKCSQ